MKDLICVGYNAGGKLGSFDTLCAFVDTLSIVHRSWSIVFVSELDGSLSETLVRNLFEVIPFLGIGLGTAAVQWRSS